MAERKIEIPENICDIDARIAQETGLCEDLVHDALLDLDEWRESSDDNMFGVAPELAELLGIPVMVARKLLTAWMETYSLRQHLLTGPNVSGVSR